MRWNTLLPGYFLIVLVSYHPALAQRGPWFALGDVALSRRRGSGEYGLAAFLTFSGRVIYPAMPPDQGFSASPHWATRQRRRADVGHRLHLLPVPVAAIAIHLLSPQSNRLASISVMGTAKILRPSIAQRQAPRFDLLRLPLIGRLLRARYGGWHCKASRS